MEPSLTQKALQWLGRGFQLGWKIVALVALLNTALAALEGIDDTRPFIYPLITTQSTGFAIAYWVSCFRPWEARRHNTMLAIAVGCGTLTGMVINLAIKVGFGLYTVAYYVHAAPHIVLDTFWTGLNGLLISAFIVNQLRESYNKETLHQVESARLLLARQAIEAELKLMQAQVEPHFLFNTLSNVQFLVETNPAAAATMLGHLTDYLRAAIPQLRQHTTTLAQEARLAESYLAILQMRMGKRLRYRIEIPPELGCREIPPMMLLSLVENAIKHGLEPSADGGEVVIAASLHGSDMRVVVSDTGRGLREEPGTGVGLSSIRDRLSVLYRGEGRLCLEENTPRGVIATLHIPEEADA
ncbi:MAG: histidine kinase [Burkholderiales bacterium]|nr:histidine kinase [Burkholderiales bacterium]